MSIKNRIMTDLKDAMRSKDQKKLEIFRLITAAIKQIEVDKRIAVVEDEQLLPILSKLIKQRKESIVQFEVAKRDDLVAQERYELDIIKQYLPDPLPESEIIALIDKALIDLSANKPGDMGKVMNHLKPLLQGRADMSKVTALIKARLS